MLYVYSDIILILESVFIVCVFLVNFLFHLVNVNLLTYSYSLNSLIILFMLIGSPFILEIHNFSAFLSSLFSLCCLYFYCLLILCVYSKDAIFAFIGYLYLFFYISLICAPLIIYFLLIALNLVCSFCSFLSEKFKIFMRDCSFII